MTDIRQNGTNLEPWWM